MQVLMESRIENSYNEPSENEYVRSQENHHFLVEWMKILQQLRKSIIMAPLNGKKYENNWLLEICSNM